MRLERTKNTKRNMAYGLAQKMLSIMFPFLIRTVMIRSLGIEYLGINNLFASILSVLSLAELGFGSALVFSMYKPIAEDDTKTICALMNFYKNCYRIIGLVVLTLGLLLLPFIRYFVKSELPPDINLYAVYLITLFTTVMTYFLYSYKNSLLIAFQRIDVSSKISFVLLTVQYLLQAILLILFRNYYFYMVIAPAVNILTNVITAMAVSRLYPEYKPEGKISGQERSEIVKKVKALVTYKIGNVVSNTVDNIVISSFLGLVILAKYNNYYYIITALFGLLSVYYSSVTAGIGNGLVKNSPGDNYRLFHNLYFVQIWLVGWMSICMLCLYQPFMRLWGRLSGENICLPMGIVVCFVIYFYTWKINDIVHIYKEAAGMWEYDRWRPLIASAFNLTLNLILVNKVGLYGVILSTVFTELIFSVWAVYALFHYYFQKELWDYYRCLIEYTLFYFVIGVITFYLCGLIGKEGLTALLLKGLICVLIPNLLFLGIVKWTGYEAVVYWLLDKIRCRSK